MSQQPHMPGAVEPSGNGGEASAQIDPALHQRLRAATKDFTYRELAELTGVSDETSRRYLEGRGPGVAYIKRLCEALNLSADWLLMGRGAPVYRTDIALGQMDHSVDEVLDGLSSNLKRLRQELARAGTRLKPAAGGSAGAEGPGTGSPTPTAPAAIPPEHFADPFAPESGSPALPPPMVIRLVLGPANSRQVSVAGAAGPELLVRVDADNRAEIASGAAAGDPGVHVYRRVFDRVYRWVSPSRPA